MNNYALIETNSGYVWWAGKADTPEDACAKAHMEGGEVATYAQTSDRIENTTEGGFLVYQAPEGFCCTDGQDQEQIDAVSAMPLIGRYRVQSDC